MINRIEITNSIPPLMPFVWENIPKLAIIAGRNGAGKSRLLRAVMEKIDTNNAAIKIDASSSLKGKLNYIPPNFDPEQIHQGNQGSAAELEGRNGQLLNYFRAKTRDHEQGNKPKQSPILEEVLSEIAARLNKTVEQLEESEVVAGTPTDLAIRLGSYLNNQYISEICYSYLRKLDQLKIRIWDRDNSGLTEESLVKQIGHEKPWVVINQLFETYGFEFRLIPPVSDVGYYPRFQSISSDASPIQFSALSDGEKLIVTLILWSYNAYMGQHIKLFLLDEFDSHLNPAMSKMLLEILREKVVEEFGIQVIMTTHSPSTIARAKDEEVFWMERGQPIRPSSRSEIIPILSDGIITVTEEEASLKFMTELGASDAAALCVEGITDKLILETAWRCIYPKRECPFQIFDMFDCHFIINSFRRAAIFDNYPKKKFVGLIDFDNAHKDAVEKFTNKEEKRIWKTEMVQAPKAKYFERSDKLGIVTTITVPAHRSEYVYPNLSDGALSIELLFPDSVVGRFCREKSMLGGGVIKVFKSEKKLVFAKDIVPTCQEADFVSFAELFEHLEAMFQKLAARN